MKKYIIPSLLLILCSNLLATSTTKLPIPMYKKYLSTDNGGALSALAAYRDGVGLFISTGTTTVADVTYDNSSMNELVYTYGNQAENLNLTIKEVATQDATTNNTEALNTLGNFISMSELVDGMPCDDGNIQTINDQYVTEICIGTNVEGLSCNDNNLETINDIYHNGICNGTFVQNGTLCDDGNPNTLNDNYFNGVCAGTLIVEGASCNDGDTNTFNDKYVNGVCTGTYIASGAECAANNQGYDVVTGTCVPLKTSNCANGYTGVQDSITCVCASSFLEWPSNWYALKQASSIYFSCLDRTSSDPNNPILYPRFQDFSGLINVTSLKSLTYKNSSFGLTNLDGLNNVTDLNSLYLVRRPASLTNLNGIKTSIDTNRKFESLVIDPERSLDSKTAYRSLLSDISALTNLEEIDTLRLIRTNIKDLNGLKNLKRVNQILYIDGIYSNEQVTSIPTQKSVLNDLSGLNNLTYVKEAVLENKPYQVKMNSDSYLCKNFGVVKGLGWVAQPANYYSPSGQYIQRTYYSVRYVNPTKSYFCY